MKTLSGSRGKLKHFPALGIDWGEKYLGFALTDKEGKFCFPRGEAKVQDLREACGVVERKAKAWGARAIVIGLPLTLKGERGKQARRVLRFAARLRRLSLPVFLEDERFTTCLAGKIAEEEKYSPHAVAAYVILQSWLKRQQLRDN
jgi:putative Holliday junction resolvase